MEVLRKRRQNMVFVDKFTDFWIAYGVKFS